jgi:hypothetical protein
MVVRPITMIGHTKSKHGGFNSTDVGSSRGHRPPAVPPATSAVQKPQTTLIELLPSVDADREALRSRHT